MHISMWSIGLILLIAGLVQKFGFLHTGLSLLGFSLFLDIARAFLAQQKINRLKSRIDAGFYTH